MDIKLERECRFHKDGRQYYSCIDLPIDINKEIPGVVSWDPSKNRFYLEWMEVKSRMVISKGEARISIVPGYTTNPQILVLHFPPGSFPPAPSGRLYFPSFLYGSPLPFTANITIELDVRPISLSEPGIAMSFAASLVDRTPNNIRFFFPRTGKELWANEKGLRASSAYFETLFSSSFVEATSTSIERCGSMGDTDLSAPNGDDSDDETDEIAIEISKAPSSSSTTAETSGAPFKTITIVDTAYSTYFTALLWMGTGNVRFAPLRSSFEFPSNAASPATASRRDWLLVANDQYTDALPLPCSPKSLYRLAHLLELDGLAQLALENFSTQLSIETVAHELFTDIASTYPALRDVAVAYAVQNWKEVAKSKALKKVKERADLGELDSGVLLAIELMKEHGPK